MILYFASDSKKELEQELTKMTAIDQVETHEDPQEENSSKRTREDNTDSSEHVNKKRKEHQMA